MHASNIVSMCIFKPTSPAVSKPLRLIKEVQMRKPWPETTRNSSLCCQDLSRMCNFPHFSVKRWKRTSWVEVAWRFNVTLKGNGVLIQHWIRFFKDITQFFAASYAIHVNGEERQKTPWLKAANWTKLLGWYWMISSHLQSLDTDNFQKRNFMDSIWSSSALPFHTTGRWRRTRYCHWRCTEIVSHIVKQKVSLDLSGSIWIWPCWIQEIQGRSSLKKWPWLRRAAGPGPAWWHV